jgi:membrane protein DedA with SNARE-associated domain
VGFYLLHKYGRYLSITDEKLQRVKEWFNRGGKWTLPVGYFIPGVRHLTAYVAGASRLQYPIFALFAYAGGLIWSVTFILLGYFIGEGWENIPAEIESKLLIALGVLVAVGIVFYVLKKLRKV